MELRLRGDAHTSPVPVGGSTHQRKIVACLQDDTIPTFRPAMRMVGTLHWVTSTKEAVGDSGHIDRRGSLDMPAAGPPAVTPGAGPRVAHQSASQRWFDLSVWRQFDRRIGNAQVPFTGVTTTYADGTAPVCVEDLEVTTTGYVRWPNTIRPLMRPPSKARYLPNPPHPQFQGARTRVDLRASCSRSRTRTADRIHGRPVPLPRDHGRKARPRFGIAEATNAMYEIGSWLTFLQRRSPVRTPGPRTGNRR